MRFWAEGEEHVLAPIVADSISVTPLPSHHVSIAVWATIVLWSMLDSTSAIAAARPSTLTVPEADQGTHVPD